MKMKLTYFLCGSALVISLIGATYLGVKLLKSTSSMVEVKGLSEKIVKSDIGEIIIKISNRNDNIDDLYKKTKEDSEKTIAFLKNNNVDESEITYSDIDIFEDSEAKSEIKDAKEITEKKIFYRSTYSVKIMTKQIEKIKNIRSNIVKDLMSQKIFVSYNYSYKITNFSDIKLDMMKEASEHARKSAEAFLAPYCKKLGRVKYLRQGEITIKGENDSCEDYQYHDNTSSVNKKLRLVVQAGFLQE